MVKQPKIIVWDIETTPIVSYSWSLYPTSISPDSVIRDWTIICGAWKAVGDKKVESVQVTDVDDDYKVVKTLREALADADIIVHHNGDSFDIKKLNTRLIFHKLPPLPNIPTVDTKKLAKKIAAFSSNKMDYLSKILTGERKIHTDYELWLRCMKNEHKALDEMAKYNRHDVEVNERLYLALRPYAKTHPHIGVMKEENKASCPKCGSSNVVKNGIRTSTTGLKKQEYQCNDCGSYHTTGLKI